MAAPAAGPGLQNPYVQRRTVPYPGENQNGGNHQGHRRLAAEGKIQQITPKLYKFNKNIVLSMMDKIVFC